MHGGTETCRNAKISVPGKEGEPGVMMEAALQHSQDPKVVQSRALEGLLGPNLIILQQSKISSNTFVFRKKKRKYLI